MNTKENKVIEKDNTEKIYEAEMQTGNTNKSLLTDVIFDNIKWWHNLNEFWQTRFNNTLERIMLELEIKQLNSKINSSLGISNEEEQTVVILKAYIERKKEIDTQVINILLKLKKTAIR
jgi:hypothetical protein